MQHNGKEKAMVAMSINVSMKVEEYIRAIVQALMELNEYVKMINAFHEIKRRKIFMWKLKSLG